MSSSLLPDLGQATVAGPHSEAHPDEDRLQALAKRHLWMHFTRLSAYAQADVPIMVRGEGPYLWDSKGRRYLDGLSGLFVVQVGHGRKELAAVGAEQAATLGYFPIWSYAHPTAIELAGKLAELAPADLNRVFFTTSGSEAVESAWKLARQYFRAIGQPGRYKVISRHTAYHGTTMGALAITGVPALREPFEPLTPGAFHVPNTNPYRSYLDLEGEALGRVCADAIEQMIIMEGPDTVAAVFLEPLQNAGGCLPPPPGYFARVREICDRYGVLLVSDEVICAYGRLGTMYGCDRYGYVPDMITSAKGLTSGYSPLGAVICRDHLVQPFLEGAATFAHGITWAGHPVSCAVALANLELFEREDVLGNVAAMEPTFAAMMERLGELPIVGNTRGDGFFWALELVPDKETKAQFTREQGEQVLRGFLSHRLLELGLVCRTDDRGDPVVQLAPPLVCGPEQFEEMEAVLRTALTEAWDRLDR